MIADDFENEMQYKLDNFEGPLDLLLEIIRKNKLDIADVKLADLTTQYLSYMQEIGTLDMEKASEFITMAATLLEIKSKALLPKIVEETEEEDSEQLILARLKEYKLFKEMGEELHTIESLDRFYKEPSADANQPRFVLKDMVMDKLLDAFVGILTKIDKKIIADEPKKIQKDRFTVAEKIASTKQILKQKEQVEFEELFDEGQTKSELINIFLAILELLKMQFAKIKQSGLFEKIYIYINKEIK